MRALASDVALAAFAFARISKAREYGEVEEEPDPCAAAQVAAEFPCPERGDPSLACHSVRLNRDALSPHNLGKQEPHSLARVGCYRPTSACSGVLAEWFAAEQPGYWASKEVRCYTPCFDPFYRGNRMNIKETASKFFEACETGKGWKECQQYCHSKASFSAQAAALAEIDTLEAYCDWMKGLLTPVPDGSYELRSFAVDHERQNVTAFAVFTGTHSGEGGPVPPTGKRVEADYVYVMQFEGDTIKHMTKVWNDNISLQQLGWTD